MEAVESSKTYYLGDVIDLLGESYFERKTLESLDARFGQDRESIARTPQIAWQMLWHNKYFIVFQPERIFFTTLVHSQYLQQT